jgi:hypothetical protein
MTERPYKCGRHGKIIGPDGGKEDKFFLAATVVSLPRNQMTNG